MRAEWIFPPVSVIFMCRYFRHLPVCLSLSFFLPFSLFFPFLFFLFLFDRCLSTGCLVVFLSSYFLSLLLISLVLPFSFLFGNRESGAGITLLKQHRKKVNQRRSVCSLSVRVCLGSLQLPVCLIALPQLHSFIK